LLPPGGPFVIAMYICDLPTFQEAATPPASGEFPSLLHGVSV
jgi:hypothetical protein